MNIKYFFLIVIYIFFNNIIFSDEIKQKQLQTVKYVNLEKYAGKWYEIAKIPNFFQKKCKKNTTAEYTLMDNQTLQVVNRCYGKNEEIIETNGIAKIVDFQTNAKLKVSFLNICGFRPFWGDYWIIGLDTEYTYAIIGTPNRKYGWLLSKSPYLSENILNTIQQELEKNGYHYKDFEFTIQNW